MNSSSQRSVLRSWPRQSNLWFGLALASALFLFPLLFGATNGSAWQPFGLRGETVLSLAIASNQGEAILYAETPTGLWRRVTGSSAGRLRGGAWRRIDADLPHSSLGAPDVAAWRNVPGRPLQLYALAGPHDARQLFRTDDGGETWRSVGPAPGQTQSPTMTVLPGLGGLADSIIIATQTRVQRSLDGGATWTPGGEWPEAAAGVDDPVAGLLAEASAPDRLLALARSGVLWISESGGLSWHEAAAPRGVRAVALEPYFGLRVWAAGDEGVASSADNGETWSELSLPGESDGWLGDRSGHVTALRIDPRVPETVYAAVRGGAIYRSDDSGQNWQFLGAPGSTQITSLALEPDDRSILYAATDDGIWARPVAPMQPTPAPGITETPIPTDTPTALPTAPQTPTLTRPPTVTATSTATPARTASPAATQTPTATATARPTRRPTQAPPASPTPTAVATTPTSGGPTAPPAGPTAAPLPPTSPPLVGTPPYR